MTYHKILLRLTGIFLAACLILAGCSPSDEPVPDTDQPSQIDIQTDTPLPEPTAEPTFTPYPTVQVVLPAADQILALGESCAEIYQAQIEAWISKDTEKLRAVYTDDIVHFDGKPLFVGIDEVLGMAQMMFRAFPRWEMKAGPTYISQNECLGTWMFWNTSGWKEEDPGIEFDILETREGKISFWRLFYDHHFDSDRIDEGFLQDFAAAWSKGDLESVLGLYSPDAVVEDTLLGVVAYGPEAIRVYADTVLSENPEISWELTYPFAEDDFANGETEVLASKGGTFTITTLDGQGSPCQIQAVLILTPDGEGKIQHQKTFYDAGSLRTCGWAD
jgi:ketosteroid isomerase-like protein